MSLKPTKKTDKELFALIEDNIYQKKYVFLVHSRLRLKERHISELDVLSILLGKKGYGRKRNKKKDSFENPSIIDLAQDWKYCIEGYDIDGSGIRIILTFTEDLMPIITVISI